VQDGVPKCVADARGLKMETARSTETLVVCLRDVTVSQLRTSSSSSIAVDLDRYFQNSIQSNCFRRIGTVSDLNPRPLPRRPIALQG
jgi:hypothetical protein